MFGLWGGGRVTLQVEWEQERVYRPGERVPVRVHLRTQGRPKIRQVVVGLAFWQRFQYPDWEEEEDGSLYYITIWEEREQWFGQSALPLPKPLPKDFQGTFTGEIVIPQDVPPPHEGRVCQGRWYLKAVADRPLRPDTIYQAPLQLVVPPPGLWPETGFYGRPSHPQRVEMQFHLPGLEFVEGEVVEGALHVRAHGPLQARRVQVVLEVQEFIPYRLDTMPGLTFEDGSDRIPDMAHTERVEELTLNGALELKAVEQRVFPFRLTVPVLRKPTCLACGPGGTIRWILRGMLERPWRRDFRVEQEVYVFNGR